MLEGVGTMPPYLIAPPIPANVIPTSSPQHHQARSPVHIPFTSKPPRTPTPKGNQTCPAKASASRPLTARASRLPNTPAMARPSAQLTRRPSRPSSLSFAPCCSSSPRRTPRTYARTRRSALSLRACAPPSASTRSRAAASRAPAPAPAARRRPSGPSCWGGRSTISTLSSPCGSSKCAGRRGGRMAG